MNNACDENLVTVKKEHHGHDLDWRISGVINELDKNNTLKLFK